jgi:hypothetical protein
MSMNGVSGGTPRQVEESEHHVSGQNHPKNNE